MLQPKTSSATSADANKTVAPTTVDDSDEQGGEDSSSSSSSDSSDSSDDDCATPTTSSIMVMNEKLHVVHAVPLTNNECSKRSSRSSQKIRPLRSYVDPRSWMHRFNCLQKYHRVQKSADTKLV